MWISSVSSKQCRLHELQVNRVYHAYIFTLQICILRDGKVEIKDEAEELVNQLRYVKL